MKMRLKHFLLIPILYCFINTSVFSQSNSNTQALNFREITTDIGLSHTNITSVVQDQKGYMWFGSNHGLNRYNGFEIKSFFHNSSDTSSLSSSRVSTLFEDRQENLWIGTRDGVVNKYLPQSETFDHYKITDKEFGILSISEDSSSNLWIGTLRNALFQLNTLTKEVTHFPYQNGDISISQVWTLNKNFLLIGTRKKGLLIFDLEDQTYHSIDQSLLKHKNIRSIQSFNNQIWVATPTQLFTLSSESFSNPKQIVLNEVSLPKYAQNLGFSAIYPDKQALWCGSKNGLLKICITSSEYRKYKFDLYRSEQNKRNSLLSNTINAVYKDRFDVLWVASTAGINSTSSFSLPLENLYLPELEKEKVNSTYEDKFGQTWLGLNSGSIIKLSEGKVKRYSRHQIFGESTQGEGSIEDFCEDPFGNLWIASWGNGLRKIDLSKEKQGNIRFKNVKNELLSSNIITSVEMYNNKLYIGTFKRGLNKVSFEANGRISKVEKLKYRQKVKASNQIISNTVNHLYHDTIENCLWMSSPDGICKIKDETNRTYFSHYNTEKKNFPLPNNFCWEMLRTSKSHLWVGSVEDGLYKLTFDSLNFKQSNLEVFRKSNGLSSNSIQSLAFDKASSTLWIGSNGLNTINIKNHQVHKYDTNDGILGSFFRIGNAINTDKGELLFVSNKGLNKIQPNVYQSNPTSPQIVLESFSLFGKPISQGDTINGDIILPKTLGETNKVILAHNQNNIEIGFMPLHFGNPSKNHVRYKLEGFDQQWMSTSRSSVVYSNLKHGKYTFKVQAVSSDGIKSEHIRELEIIIKTPWWLTWIAFLSYAVILFLIIWKINELIINRHKLKQQLELEHFKAQKTEELTLMKIRFFVNISHELRTPLTLISSPLENLLQDESLNASVKEYLSTMKQNTDRLLVLFDQLLDFRKIETGNHKVSFEKVEVIKFCRMVTSSFKNIAKDNKINYSFHSHIDKLNTWIDKDSIEKIIYNLVSNSFKNTSKGGNILVDIHQKTDKEFQICVSDSGIGIDKEDQKNLFKLFYQTKNKTDRGSGIGLALVKELVDAHYGKIEFESEKGKGTKFILTFPTGNSFMKPDELAKEKVKEKPKKVLEVNNTTEETKDEKKQSILIVEDNEDIAAYLKNELDQLYNISIASNGKIGLDKTRKEIPDLIISDVMMDEMDGIELCKQVKSNAMLNHIPIILLTARSNDVDKLEGIKSGADAYITKPFKNNYLKATITNLLEERKSVKQFFATKKDASLQSSDPEKEAFLVKAQKVVEDNLLETDFDTQIFAEKMGLTYATLYNRLKKYDNVSPTAYIRLIRLKHAAKLIANTDNSIKEIQFLVGFNDAKYFRSNFKKYFDITPSEYLKKYRKIEKTES
ncbi:hybrid sensor histidine kinase/response regulator transcription factor [Sediminitomix flava]|uniref:histidine kinase n=1 Tax=Sediminitomix flava TaxID=379075 RepID=A0A315ZA54_SEDFL|nr:hybrid sensor histidine kinase/response regulator transcription factor [Sediminitomix flava]PWJ41943.1 signal transduction histidine kinase [Sediminitomix flava]